MKLSMKETMSNILAYLLKCERKTLLWTNPNPTSSFSGQTIAMDLSNYDAVEVEIAEPRPSLHYDAVVTPISTIKKDAYGYVLYLHTIRGSGANENTGIRRIHPTASGIIFEDYKYKNRRTGTITTDNIYCIPYKIYGIKLGGVLHKSLTSVFTAISKIGGGVDESLFEADACKDPHANSADRNGIYGIVDGDLHKLEQCKSDGLRPLACGDVYSLSESARCKSIGSVFRHLSKLYDRFTHGDESVGRWSERRSGYLRTTTGSRCLCGNEFFSGDNLHIQRKRLSESGSHSIAISERRWAA